MTRTYRNQFTIDENRPLTVPAWLHDSVEWEDVSWGNDVSPRFENTSLLVAVWVDYDNPNDREYEDYSKYTVQRLTIDERGERHLGNGQLLETDDEAELLDFVRYLPVQQAMDRAQFELSAVLEGLYQLPESELNSRRISFVEAAIDELVTAVNLK